MLSTGHTPEWKNNAQTFCTKTLCFYNILKVEKSLVKFHQNKINRPRPSATNPLQSRKTAEANSLRYMLVFRCDSDNY